MSFILDAIAKSEQERLQQEIPNAQILALPTSSVPQPRRVLPYLVVGALILNAALLAIWLQSDLTFLNKSSPTQVENIDRLNQQTVVIEDRPAPVEVTANATTATVTTELNNIKPMNGSSTDRPGGTSISTQSKATEPVSEVETSRPEPVATTTSGGTNTWERIEPGTLSDKLRSGQQAELDTDMLQPKISRLGELPRAVRNDLPTVVFSGHLYSSNPDSSLVFLDGGRPVKKGQQIANDLFLHEITPTGVIVNFRGYLIDVGVLQNWTLN